MGKYNVDELRTLCNEGSRIYIQGTEITSMRVFYDLLRGGIPVSGFITDDLQNTQIKELYGLPVCSGEDGIAVAEVLGTEHLPKTAFNIALMLTMINSRFHNRPSVFVIHRQDFPFWNTVITTMKLEEASILCVENGLDCLYDLCYQDTERLIVAIAASDMEEEIATLLKLMGLQETKNILYIHNSFSGNITSKYKGFDWMLGNTYEPHSDYPGFSVYKSFNGENAEDGILKIVIIGNSATDPLFYPHTSWPEYLSEIHRKNGINSIIYNGAITDYSSGNELLKLLRDGMRLSPDVVISYSGVIDFRDYIEGYPFINLNLKRTIGAWETANPNKKAVLGIKDTRSAYDRWLNNEEIMQAVCQLSGCQFFGILQPWIGSNICGDNGYLRKWFYNYWRIEYPEFSEYLHNAKMFASRIKTDRLNKTWLQDFTGIFADYSPDDIYYDSVHINETGNQIVAERIAQLLEHLQ